MRLSSRYIRSLKSQDDNIIGDYNRDEQQAGIVHFGLGAFTRAHQAIYSDAVMSAGDKDWMIIGISMRSDTVAQQLNPQDGLYHIAIQSGEDVRYHLGQSIRRIWVAPQNPKDVIAACADQQIKIISFTITEKGYCRNAEGHLDWERVDGSIYPLLIAALRIRKDGGSRGVTLLSCDNLSHNGALLSSLMREYIAAKAPDLLDWFAENCTCPSSMVDRIVPATTEAEIEAAQNSLGFRDEGLVVTEPFSQWVIEDDFANGRPCWERAGAQIVQDIMPYEMAKLRMLNGAHSLLAYCGLKAGYDYVHEAIADPSLRALTVTLMRDEAIPVIMPIKDMDLNLYADDLIKRFENPALNHRLSQIAMDGSQKIPQRWLATLAAHQAQGRQCPAILEAIAAWIMYLRGPLVQDPMSAKLSAAAIADDPIGAIFDQNGLLPSPWVPSQADIADIKHYLAIL